MVAFNYPAPPPAILGNFSFLKLGRGTKNGAFPQDTEIGSHSTGEFLALHQPGQHSRSTSPARSPNPGQGSKPQGGRTGTGTPREGEEEKVWGSRRKAGAEGCWRCDKGVAGNGSGSTGKDRLCTETPKYQPALNCPSSFALLT